jgi:hypothetical protein
MPQVGSTSLLLNRELIGQLGAAGLVERYQSRTNDGVHGGPVALAITQRSSVRRVDAQSRHVRDGLSKGASKD